MIKKIITIPNAYKSFIRIQSYCSFFLVQFNWLVKQMIRDLLKYAKSNMGLAIHWKIFLFKYNKSLHWYILYTAILRLCLLNFAK